MRATLKRRLETLERRSTAAEITPVPIVTIAHWPEADRLAFLAADADEADDLIDRHEGYRPDPNAGGPSGVSLIVVSVHASETPVEPVQPVTRPPVPSPPAEPEPDPDPLANLAEELEARERRRAEAEWEQGIREREARRASQWF
jgi:hypothetical protein